MTELVVGQKYKDPLGEILIIAHSPVTGNYIGQSRYGTLLRYTNDGRLLVYGADGKTIDGGYDLQPTPKEIEVEYTFWINFYKDGTVIRFNSETAAGGCKIEGCIETKKFTHKAKYTQ